MAGPKKYVRDDLLDKATALFQRHGYTATSTSHLVEELEVNRKSLYAEFGSKQELFEIVLQRYSDQQLSIAFAPIEHPNAGVHEILAAFDNFASASEGPVSGLGCLVANTAVERAALDPGSARIVNADLERLKLGCQRALCNAHASGDIGTQRDLDDLAAFLVMSLLGISTLIRAKVPSEQVYAASRITTSLLEPQVKY